MPELEAHRDDLCDDRLTRLRRNDPMTQPTLDIRTPDAAWRRLSSEHLPAMMWRQRLLAEVVGDRPWGLDLEQGVVTFGSDLSFPMQLLGTESLDGSWMWAWANEASGLSARVTAMSAYLRSVGDEQDVSVLTAPMLAVEEEGDAFLLALIASGIAGGLPVYRGPHSGGALYFALEDVKLPATGLDPVGALLTLSQSLQTGLPMEHRVLVTSFARRTGTAYVESDRGVVLQCAAGDAAVDLDEQGRIVGLRSGQQDAA
jgi:hypothetical protein